MKKINIYCGETIKDKCSPEKHPVDEVLSAKEMVDKGFGKNYSNDPDFISTIKYYGEYKGVEVEFFLDGVSHGNNIDPIFKDLNRSIDLLNKLVGLGKPSDIVVINDDVPEGFWYSELQGQKFKIKPMTNSAKYGMEGFSQYEIEECWLIAEGDSGNNGLLKKHCKLVDND